MSNGIGVIDGNDLVGMGGRYWYAMVTKLSQSVLKRVAATGDEDLDREIHQLLSLMEQGPWRKVDQDARKMFEKMFPPTRPERPRSASTAPPLVGGDWEVVKDGPIWDLEYRTSDGQVIQRRGREAERIFAEQAIAEWPYLGEPMFRWALGAWARNEIDCANRLHELEATEPDTDERVMRRAAYNSTMRLTSKLRADLGLSPKAQKEIQKLV